MKSFDSSYLKALLVAIHLQLRSFVGLLLCLVVDVGGFSFSFKLDQKADKMYTNGPFEMD